MCGGIAQVTTSVAMPWPEYTLRSSIMATLGVRMYEQLSSHVWWNCPCARSLLCRCVVVCVCSSVAPGYRAVLCVIVYFLDGGWRYSNLIDFCTFSFDSSHTS
jgi:hypothetical protein